MPDNNSSNKSDKIVSEEMKINDFDLNEFLTTNWIRYSDKGEEIGKKNFNIKIKDLKQQVEEHRRSFAKPGTSISLEHPILLRLQAQIAELTLALREIQHIKLLKKEYKFFGQHLIALTELQAKVEQEAKQKLLQHENARKKHEKVDRKLHKDSKPVVPRHADAFWEAMRKHPGRLSALAKIDIQKLLPEPDNTNNKKVSQNGNGKNKSTRQNKTKRR